MTGNSTPPRQSNRPLRSCTQCADRKVKCDRQYPCNACVKHSSECIYRPFPPPKRRLNRIKEHMLNDKLKRYEAILREQGIDPEHTERNTEIEQLSSPRISESTQSEHLQLPTPGRSSNYSEPERAITKTQLVHDQGRSQFVDNGLWSRVVEELHDPQEVLHASDDDSDGEIESGDDFDFTLGITPRDGNEHPHPNTESINLLWLIFTENVDPLTKIVHAPTMQEAIRKATDNMAGITRGFEALMFAMYSLAVLSLTDQECKQKFGQLRKALLSHYVSATKIALSRAKFMSTTSIVVLQALILHIFCIRYFYEPRAVWTLTGIAIRIAEGMGMHHDGTSWGLPPFEVEIRRRVWWQLKLHDFRTCELSGLAKFQGVGSEECAPQPPANVNDSDLYPGMTAPPTVVTGPTDMMFCLLRCELGATYADKFRRFWNANVSTDELTAKDQAMKAVENHLETRFARYCDPTQPLHLMTLMLVRTAINIGRFVTHHPRRWESESQVPESEQQLVWSLSIKILEHFEMSQTNSQLKQFRWHSYYFMPWHVFIHVLDTLRSQPIMPDAEKAWRLVESTYNNNPGIMTNNRPLHVVVGNLCLKAFNARENAIKGKEKNVSTPPAYIQNLRRARETAMTRRFARVSRGSKQIETNSSDHQSGSSNGNVRSNLTDYWVDYLSPIKPKSQDNQSDLVQQHSLPEPKNHMNDDMFWFNNGIANNVPIAAPGSTMNVDTDLMLAQSYGNEDSPGQAINWAQWEAWLGSVNDASINPMAVFDSDRN